jgi:hypothetical protein
MQGAAKINIFNRNYFLLTTDFKLLTRLKGKPINDFDFFKLITSVIGGPGRQKT